MKEKARYSSISAIPMVWSGRVLVLTIIIENIWENIKSHHLKNADFSQSWAEFMTEWDNRSLYGHQYFSSFRYKNI